jgi:outer membrane receptor protein involved in Fe transport
MRKNSNRGSLLATTVFAGMFFAAPAFAQEGATQDVDDQANQENAVSAQADQSPSDSELQGDTGEIVVTGSRIQRRDLTATSPLAVVNDEEFKLSGATNVEQVLNTLPQVVPGFTSASNNPGNGTATIDLRGLGAARTLVLVNGRRYIFSDVNQLVDLNTIPQFLVDSVDVVTGGASAVYGSDALAGVVNFRLRDDIEGIETGGQVGITERGDGRRLNLYAAIGTRFADDRGYVTAFAEYTKRKSIFGSDRSFAAVTLGDDGEGGLTPLGSSTPVEGRLIYFGGANSNTEVTSVLNNAFFEVPGVARPRTGADTFNYGAVNYLQIPQERYSIGGYGEFEISPAVTFFGEAQFVNNRVAQELAATPVTGFFDVDIATVTPFLSPETLAEFQNLDEAETAQNAADGLADDPGVVNIFVQRRTAEVGARNTLDERNAFRILGGVKGPVIGNFDYEAYYMYARTRNANVQQGNVSRAAFAAGLDGTGPVPINIFGPNTLTPEQVGSFSILAQNNDISELKVASGSIAGTAGNLGWGGEDIGLAAGVEYRKVSSQFIPDTALASGDVIGFNAGQATQGSYNVKEIFGEVRLPIAANQPGIYRLELNAAGRYSDYSLEAVGGVKSYAAGIQYAPVRDITLRAQYQRAVRAPNVAELFGGLANGFPAAVDPCATEAAANPANTGLRQTCIDSGVPEERLGDPDLQLNEQIEGRFGGFAGLEEETSDTITFGAVIRPSFIPGLALTVDAYDIKIENVIDVFGGGVNSILDLCFNQFQDINSVYCQAVNRNSAGVISGDQFVVTALNANIAKLETRGLDFQVDYSRDLGFSMLGRGSSKVNFFFLGTYTKKFDITPVVGFDTVNECAGRFGQTCGNPRPKYKWSSRLSLIDGPLTSSLRWRHTGKVRDDTGGFTVDKLKAYNLFDLAFSLDATDQVSFSFGVNNLFDKKPQLIGDNQEQANTYPSVYDVLGRDYFVSASFRF